MYEGMNQMMDRLSRIEINPQWEYLAQFQLVKRRETNTGMLLQAKSRLDAAAVTKLYTRNN